MNLVGMARVEAVIGHPDGAPRYRGFDSYTDVLTEKGRRKPLARRCLAFFDRLG